MIELPPDISFYIQLVAFVVFWQLMKPLLFTPVQRALQERHARTAGSQRTAETLRTESATLQGQLDAELHAARAEGARRADEIRRQSETEERATLDRYQAEANAVLERERAETSRQVDAARAPLHEVSERLADDVVVKVLGRAA